MAGEPARPWFEYRRSGHRLKAVPVHAKGWAALALLVALPIAAPLALLGTLRHADPAPLVLILVASLLVDYVAILWLLRTRGRLRR
jgi:uncharacterized RDD family membrane protein YckC